jgi:5,10-methylenetetrahydrofolate reductase
VPGIIIPEAILGRMSQAGDQGALRGIEIGIELVEHLRPLVQGIYIMPAFNRFDYAAEIIEAVKSKGAGTTY